MVRLLLEYFVAVWLGDGATSSGTEREPFLYLINIFRFLLVMSHYTVVVRAINQINFVPGDLYCREALRTDR